MYNKFLFTLAFISLFFNLGSSVQAATTIYVNINAAGNNDGGDWNNAFLLYNLHLIWQFPEIKFGLQKGSTIHHQRMI